MLSLIHISADQQGSRFLTLKNIGEIEVGVSPHATLKTTQGVVVSLGLLNCMEEEITTVLAQWGNHSMLEADRAQADRA